MSRGGVGDRAATLTGMTPTDLHTALATRRPLFHSEADFQHELARELRARGLGRGVRLERPFDLPERLNVDLVGLTGLHDVGWRPFGPAGAWGEPRLLTLVVGA